MVDYGKAMRLQKIVHSQRVSNTRPDTLILLEHPDTITLGRRAKKHDLLSSDEDLKNLGVKVFHTDRGGQATYHGKGQLIIYPIINIKDHNFGPISYVRFLEKLIKDTVGEFGIESTNYKNETGVWVYDKFKSKKKIASIGVKISNGVTFHGVALNVSTKLQMFNHIIPCGISSTEFTNVNNESESKITFKQVSNVLISKITLAFDKEPLYEDFYEKY